MLNLVQLQERLKDIPMQALMQYANGANPQVPPFLALGELNRRKKMQEGAAADQAKEMEGAPTVKDQIEQASGLLALQGSRQRQAAQQQQGIQAAMPMAAPNTTTSEPAQMAEGGAVNDIVVPRDYQVGGQVSQMDPNMLRKLAMLKAMKQRQGVSSIPVGDMFKRSDFAGGGIVAFEAGGSVKRVSGKTLAEYLASVSDALKANTQMTEQEKIDAIDRARVQFMNSPSDDGAVDPNKYQDESTRGIKTPQQRPAQAPMDLGAFAPTRQAPSSLGGLGALSKFLKISPEEAMPMEEPRSIEAIIAEQKRRQGLAGVNEDFLAQREGRLAEIQARREKEREGQPMDRLMEMLSGIAEARGGNWATQGAAGAKRAMALEAQQKSLRDKQDMEMEELKFTVASKRDAIRRGDLKEAEALEGKEKDLKRAIQTDRINLIKSQAGAETSGRQAEANILQANRPTDFERQKELYLQHARETGEKPTAAGFQKFMLGAKASTVMTMEDAIRIAAQSLGPGASMQEIQQRATELMRLGTGAAGATIPSTGNRPPLSSFQK